MGKCTLRWLTIWITMPIFAKCFFFGYLTKIIKFIKLVINYKLTTWLWKWFFYKSIPTFNSDILKLENTTCKNISFNGHNIAQKFLDLFNKFKNVFIFKIIFIYFCSKNFLKSWRFLINPSIFFPHFLKWQNMLGIQVDKSLQTHIF